MTEIIPASPQDAEAILRLQQLAYQSEARLYNDFMIPPLTQDLQGIRNDLGRMLFLKVEVQGEIIGSVRGYLMEGTCHIERLIVHPDRQGQGIGTDLLKKIEDYFSEASRFELFTGQKSELNIRLYERLGYNEFKRQKINDRLTFVFLEKLR